MREVEWTKRAQSDFPMQELIIVPVSSQNEVFCLMATNQTELFLTTYVALIDTGVLAQTGS